MRIPRIYHPVLLQGVKHCELSEDAANHVGRVLRMQAGDKLVLSMAQIMCMTRRLRRSAKNVLK